MSKNRVILVNYSSPPEAFYYFFPDNGLGLLSGVLLNEGYEPLVLDYVNTDTFKRFFTEEVKDALKEIQRLIDFYQNINVLKKLIELKNFLLERIKKLEYEIASELIETIKKFKPSVIGFKLWETFGIHGSARIAGEIKKHFPDIITVGGGPHVAEFQSHILDFTDSFDLLVYGEGEISLIELVKYAEKKNNIRKVPNLIYKEGGEIKNTPLELIKNIEELPSPVYDEEIYPAMKGNKKIKAFLIEASRGCPNMCNFCLHPKKSGNIWRSIRPGKFVDLMDEIRNKYSSSMIRFADSSPPPGLVTNISKEIIKRGRKYDFGCFSHVKNYYEEDYNIMRKAGCQAIMYGIESGSQYILDEAIGKGIKVEDSRATLKATKKAGIYTIANIIVPSPFETQETMKETLDLMFDTKPDSAVVHFAILSPYTAWWDNPEKYGFRVHNKKKVAEKLMKMIRTPLYPPMLWDKFPYRLNKKRDIEMMKIIQEIKERLQAKGIGTSVVDYMALLALGSNKDVEELQKENSKYLWTGDYEKVNKIVTTINQTIKERAKSSSLD